jgi:hypothetical protein
VKAIAAHRVAARRRSSDAGAEEVMARFLRSVASATVLVLLWPCVADTQTRPAATAVASPDFRVWVIGDTATGFTAQIGRYFELRRQLEGGLPVPVVTDDVRQIRRGTRSLAKAIRLARPGAVQGEFFTPETSVEIRRALTRIMTATVWSVIMDDNPGAFSHEIDGSYPDGAPRSTMPGLVLAQLPSLPDGIEFRFAGPHLILYDVRANTIIDRLPDAIGCTDWCGRVR